ncbi:hypothetical protein HL658_13245 [Azospirillum sp. RWY-5-1]|uniref:Glycosyltransferase RgtA/B/C/D-like domain-containing protein n=1 Tax=Azospirillum oleiclasticum TaxID=2735135 RepID=A0ABX2T8M6_9PROT|nr:hypothetical protein [Azospirillum oleiclasticum]NYZ13520.1 hypothetical protein [Azospirillum oleiclasticum]NYZ20681.1 hypothetical protein [Azospirillum oleiclasticum]
MVRGWIAACAAVAVVWLLLMASLPILAMPRAALDDALFVRQAAYLLSGQWLGPYDHSTLAKGPFYPMVIAASWAAGLPLMVVQALAYAAACWALVRGLRPWLGREGVAAGIFLLLLLNPMVYATANLRVMREGIYVPLTLLVVAGLVWWVRLADARLRARLALAAGLGATLAAFWLTREEGVWILPSLLLAAGLWAVVLGRAGGLRALRTEAALAVVAAAVAVAGVGTVALANRAVYGVADIVEFKQDAFTGAYGALSRVRHAAETPYVPVPRTVLEQVFAVSPAAAELRDGLGAPADKFVRAGCAVYAVEPCDGEIRAAWFMWALRQAAADAGHHTEARDASAFYGRLADEVDAACADGRLDCGPPRRGMSPPFRWDTAWPTVRATARALLFIATLEGGGAPRDAHSCRIDDCREPWTLPVILDLTGADLFVLAAGTPDPIAHNRLAGGQALPSQQRAALAAGLLDRVYGLYRIVLPWAVVAALAGLGWHLARALRGRRAPDPLAAVALVALAAVGTRAVLMAYLEVVAMPAINPLYLSPAYPLLLLFCAAAIGAAIKSPGAQPIRVDFADPARGVSA